MFIDLDDVHPSDPDRNRLRRAPRVVDDIRGLRPGTKMLAVVLIALIPVVAADLTFSHITLPLIGDHDIGWAGYPLTVCGSRFWPTWST